MTSNGYDVELDLTGLNCPLPILRTKKQLALMRPGELLHVRATDPHSAIDFTAFCDKTEHELVEQTRAGEEYRFVLRVGRRD